MTERYGNTSKRITESKFQKTPYLSEPITIPQRIQLSSTTSDHYPSPIHFSSKKLALSLKKHAERTPWSDVIGFYLQNTYEQKKKLCGTYRLALLMQLKF